MSTGQIFLIGRVFVGNKMHVIYLSDARSLRYSIDRMPLTFLSAYLFNRATQLQSKLPRQVVCAVQIKHSIFVFEFILTCRLYLWCRGAFYK